MRLEVNMRFDSKSNMTCRNCGKPLTFENNSHWHSSSVCDECYPGYFDGPDVVDDCGLDDDTENGRP